MLDLFNDCLVSLLFPGVDTTSDTTFMAPSLFVNVAIFVILSFVYFLIQRTFSSSLAFF